ncbi:hypothetical protein QYE76_045070 [Lolium multiflorum]|uniref:DDE Tnp4 domain-containing protein n=1 Tax=Lolium multiflorum TaxID=4521 RepID=A0AAD8TM04_LOLMU|nr:hypothetical protein QYE76_045070 [Lolium multiflorum]
MDAWHMVEKFRAEVVDSSSDVESDQSAQTLATTTASMIHEFTSNPGPQHRGSVKGAQKPARNEWRGRPASTRTTSTSPIRSSRKSCSGPMQGALGFTSYQKCSAAIRMLSYGMAAIYSMSIFEWAHARQRSRVSYEINGNAYDKPYYLLDGIYPDWATLLKTVHNPNFEKMRRFAKMQEACRKDVERGFGVLQARWAIIRHPARTWSLKTMHEVMTCCVIMHNWIVENERPDGRNENHW